MEINVKLKTSFIFGVYCTVYWKICIITKVLLSKIRVLTIKHIEKVLFLKKIQIWDKSNKNTVQVQNIQKNQMKELVRSVPCYLSDTDPAIFKKHFLKILNFFRHL